MTRDMYETLKIADLRAIAKQRGLSVGSRSRKSEIIDAMVALDEKEATEAAAGRAGGRREMTDTGRPEAAAPQNEENSVPAGETPVARAAEENIENAQSRRHTKKGQESAEADKGDRHSSHRSESRKGDKHKAEPGQRDKRAGRGGETADNRTGEGKAAERRAAGRSAEGRRAGRGAESRSSENHFSEGRTPEGRSGEGRASEGRSSEGRSSEYRSFENRNATDDREDSRPDNRAAGMSRAAVSYAAPAGQPQGSAALAGRYERRGLARPDQPIVHKNELNKELDSGEVAHGILEVMQDGFGFIRSSNYMPGDDDIYVAPSQIRRFNLKTGDVLEGNIRVRTSGEKFSALLFVKSVNGQDPELSKQRFNFEDMTPIFPNERIRLEQPTCTVAMRVMDLFCPVGKGQRGMIVSPPKAGKTTLVKEVAKSVKKNNPEIHLIILLIDERPEEVTDIKEALEGPNVEVIYSTFDELPEHHKRVAEMTIERAKRLVEQKQDVMILLDSITRLTRAYNMTEPSSGRTLSGGLDPVALHAPKRFFGAARNMREGGSLTILATALIETGSKMDDVVYEEFKGTGNMEVILNRKLSERRIFPAIDLAKSGTRRDDLLLTPDEMDAVSTVRRAFIGAKGEEATDTVLDLFAKTRTNGEFVSMIRRHSWAY